MAMKRKTVWHTSIPERYWHYYDFDKRHPGGNIFLTLSPNAIYMFYQPTDDSEEI